VVAEVGVSGRLRYLNYLRTSYPRISAMRAVIT